MKEVNEIRVEKAHKVFHFNLLWPQTSVDCREKKSCSSPAKVRASDTNCYHVRRLFFVFTRLCDIHSAFSEAQQLLVGKPLLPRIKIDYTTFTECKQHSRES